MLCHIITISGMRHLKANIGFNAVLSRKLCQAHDTGPRERIQAVNRRTCAYAFVNRFSLFDRTNLLETRLLWDHNGPQAVALQGRATFLHICWRICNNNLELFVCTDNVF